MTRRPQLLLAAALVWASLGGAPAHAAVPGPQVDVLQLSGVIDASSMAALHRAVRDASRRQVEVLMVQLDSFGSLGVSPARVRDALAQDQGAGRHVPVAIWVGPRRAQAAGAAALLLAGADVVAVSRDARIGPALPAQLGRGRDAAAEASLAAAARLPAAALRGTVDGAAAVAAGLAAYQAESLPDAVERLDGRRTAAGGTLAVSGFEVRFLSRPLLDQARHGLANPSLAYLLLLAAAAMGSFEWFQPGFGVAGVAALLVALVAAVAMVLLPTNWLALAALLAGFAVFTVDAAAGGLGLGTLLATVLTAAGSWWLFSSPSPLLRLDGRLAVAGVLWSAAWFVVVLTVVLRSQRQVPAGTEALVGARGTVRSMLNPGGIVVIDGAVWRAALVGGGSLATGQRVHVDAVAGGVLQVRAEDPDAVRPGKGRRAARGGRDSDRGLVRD